MAHRRWLDDSGIWSCRIKISNDSLRSASDNRNHNLDPKMAPAQTLDSVMETGSPSSRRNKGKLAEAIQSLPSLANSMESIEDQSDPDAQACVTDFLDFTEYLPSDVIRSLTLLGGLDQTYITASSKLHELTSQYGKIPELPAEVNVDKVNLRAEISESASRAVTARTLAHAEALRMDENLERHVIRAKNILAKLQKMQDEYPNSRENSPKADSPELTRAPPKLTFSRGTRDNGERRVPRKHRAPRITVPGEVLAPYELDYESYGSDSGSSESDLDEVATPRETPAPPRGLNIKNIKLKVTHSKKDKEIKEKKPIQPRLPRPAGAMGTNVHSAVAGISTSNALAKLQPPPAEAKNGDDHLPWLALNPYELATLRKRMKKNAIWSPSDTMIARELANLGRGYENYMKAKAEAEAAGEPFGPVPAQLRGEPVNAEGAMTLEALKSKETSNRGMKLNEAKKLKREAMAKIAAQEAAEEAESVVRGMKTVKDTMENIFNDKDGKAKKPATKTPNKAANKKRKREEPASEFEVPTPTAGSSAAAVKPVKPPLKRSKTETPVPIPQSITTKQVSPILPADAMTPAPSPAPVLTPATENAPELLAPPLPSPKKSSTPILPPTRDRKATTKKEVAKPEPILSSRPRRNEEVAPAAAPAPEPVLPAKRPSSSRGNKASSQEPTAPITASSDRPRRTSTARNTPAPPEPRQPSRRAKRPAPGVVTAESEGSTAVSVTKRSKATRKKAGPKKKKEDGRERSATQEAFDEFDDEGNLIDPNEPRYCVCNRVSFGVMIGCENKECEREWFHLECIGLDQPPPRTTKWYCPDCRKSLGLGPKGEVTARGKKK